MVRKKEDITYEIIKNLGVLSVSKANWKTEVNLISWNGEEPVIDIRAWSPDREKKGKGITLNNEEFLGLLQILNLYYESINGEDTEEEEDNFTVTIN